MATIPLSLPVRLVPLTLWLLVNFSGFFGSDLGNKQFCQFKNIWVRLIFYDATENSEVKVFWSY